MKLTRNTTADGRCKYALVRLDKLRKLPEQSLLVERAAKALDELAALGLLEYGEKGKRIRMAWQVDSSPCGMVKVRKRSKHHWIPVADLTYPPSKLPKHTENFEI